MQPLDQTDKIICIILSAGKSERMKSQKALLPFSKEENFLQHIIEVYRKSKIDEIVVVVNPSIANSIRVEDYKEVMFVRNPFTQRGRVYSLKKGLELNSDADYCFIQNIDNPFITPVVIPKLNESRKDGDYITPTYQGKGGHPVLLSAKVIRYILNLEEHDSKLNAILKQFIRVNVEVNDENILTNINTVEDYEKYFSNKAVNTL